MQRRKTLYSCIDKIIHTDESKVSKDRPVGWFSVGVDICTTIRNLTPIKLTPFAKDHTWTKIISTISNMNWTELDGSVSGSHLIDSFGMAMRQQHMPRIHSYRHISYVQMRWRNEERRNKNWKIKESKCFGCSRQTEMNDDAPRLQ